MRKLTANVLLALIVTVTSTYAIELNLAGTVISDNDKKITSRYMGIVKKMLVSEGDIVEKGQMLYEIDSKEIDSKKEQVELGISQAQLALQMNRNQYNNVLILILTRREKPNAQLQNPNFNSIFQIAVQISKQFIQELLIT